MTAKKFIHVRAGDLVDRERKESGMRVRTVFGEAWKWTHDGSYQSLPVGEALDHYDETGEIPKWVRDYLEASPDARRRPRSLGTPTPSTGPVYYHHRPTAVVGALRGK